MKNLYTTNTQTSLKNVVTIIAIFFVILLNTVMEVKGQTTFYTQGFETSCDWTFTVGSTSTNNRNYWLYGTGTAGVTTGAATHTGTASLQVWKYNSAWVADYKLTTAANQSATKTFNFSTIPVGSTITFSYWLLVEGE